MARPVTLFTGDLIPVEPSPKPAPQCERIQPVSIAEPETIALETWENEGGAFERTPALD